MNYKEIEKEATDWYANQPMGSAVRQNGPAAIEAYIAATKIRVAQMEEAVEVVCNLHDKIDALEEEIEELKERSISAPKGKKLLLKVNKTLPAIHIDAV